MNEIRGDERILHHCHGLQRWLHGPDTAEPLVRLRGAVDERTFKVLRYALARRG
jgi:hypothetical protein